MTPLESERLQKLGLAYLQILEQLTINVFFYGPSSSLVVYYDSSTNLISGVFIALFSASVVVFAFVFFRNPAYFSTRPDRRTLQAERIF